ncbi:hypothetical protein AXY30_RS03980 [Acinetobacter baumannii]|nr:hypothetical protein [Acinetobacter baumannii]
MKYLRIIINDDSPLIDVTGSLVDMGFKFDMPEQTEDIKTVIVNGDQISFYNEVVENPNPEQFTDMNLVQLIKMKVREWANISL